MRGGKTLFRPKNCAVFFGDGRGVPSAVVDRPLCGPVGRFQRVKDRARGRWSIDACGCVDFGRGQGAAANSAGPEGSKGRFRGSKGREDGGREYTVPLSSFRAERSGDPEPSGAQGANLPGARLDRSPSAPLGSGLRRNDDSGWRGLRRRQQVPCEHPITPRPHPIRRAGDVRREIVVGAVGGGGLADDGPDLFQIG